MKELFKNQLSKLLFGLIVITFMALVFGLIVGLGFLIMTTHGAVKVILIIIAILLLALGIGNND